MRPSENAYIVQPVLKALKVLEHVAGKGHEVTLTEVASELKLPKTTVFRYLQTLTAASFLRHDPARDRYGVGLRFHALAKADKGLQRLRSVAQPSWRTSAAVFNETINLAILADGHIVYIDMIEANRALRMQARSATATRCTRPRSARRSSPSCPGRTGAAPRPDASGDDLQDGDEPHVAAPPDRGRAPPRLRDRNR